MPSRQLACTHLSELTDSLIHWFIDSYLLPGSAPTRICHTEIVALLTSCVQSTRMLSQQNVRSLEGRFTEPDWAYLINRSGFTELVSRAEDSIEAVEKLSLLYITSNGIPKTGDSKFECANVKWLTIFCSLRRPQPVRLQRSHGNKTKLLIIVRGFL